jgi:hypothetical protein
MLVVVLVLVILDEHGLPEDNNELPTATAHPDVRMLRNHKSFEYPCASLRLFESIQLSSSRVHMFERSQELLVFQGPLIVTRSDLRSESLRVLCSHQYARGRKDSPRDGHEVWPDSREGG